MVYSQLCFSLLMYLLGSTCWSGKSEPNCDLWMWTDILLATFWSMGKVNGQDVPTAWPALGEQIPHYISNVDNSTHRKHEEVRINQGKHIFSREVTETRCPPGILTWILQ